MNPLDNIAVTDTAREKRGRYLTADQLRATLREGSGYVCRRCSPNHDGLYEDDEFILRGEFDGLPLDIVFTVDADGVVVITQMSQHNDSLRGRFYERVGSTAADAVDYYATDD